MRAVKSALAFLLLASSLSACNTLATRRDLYGPAKASGPYTEALYSGSYLYGRYPKPKPQKEPTVTLEPGPTEPAPL
jgi:hypothetical protein